MSVGRSSGRRGNTYVELPYRTGRASSRLASSRLARQAERTSGPDKALRQDNGHRTRCSLARDLGLGGEDESACWDSGHEEASIPFPPARVMSMDWLCCVALPSVVDRRPEGRDSFGLGNDSISVLQPEP